MGSSPASQEAVRSGCWDSVRTTWRRVGSARAANTAPILSSSSGKRAGAGSRHRLELRAPDGAVFGEAVLGDDEARAAGMVLEDPLDHRIAPREDDALLGPDVLDDALADLAVLLGAQRRALLGLELHVVGEPGLELGRLGDELPRALAGDGQHDLSVHDGHVVRLLQLMGCT